MFQRDNYLKITLPNGNYRYGYIAEVHDHGMEIIVSFYEEGISKIGYDEAANQIIGYPVRDWDAYLTKIEKKLIPLVAQQLSTEAIARELNVTPSTIRTQIRTLRIKLHLEDRVQLICYCQGLMKKLDIWKLREPVKT